MNWLFQTTWGKVLLHLIFWAAVLSLPALLREAALTDKTVPAELLTPFTQADWAIVVLFLTILIGFFYFNVGYLAPKLLLKKKLLLYFATIAVCWVMAMALILFVIRHDWLGVSPFFKNRRLYGMYAAFLLFWLASSGYRLTVAWFQSEQSRTVLENEKLKTELSFLQGQINPHFLFNTLNTIYSFAQRKSDQTGEVVLQLSNLLRYVLDTPTDTTALSDEILHLDDFIALHKLRLTAKTTVEFLVHGNPDGKQIAPMLLLPFIENAFKHGVSSHRESRIRFYLDILTDSIEFRAENQRFKTVQADTGRTGIGIQNVRRRLELLYPGKHQLDITETEELYRVYLTIQQ